MSYTDIFEKFSNKQLADFITGSDEQANLIKTYYNHDIGSFVSDLQEEVCNRFVALMTSGATDSDSEGRYDTERIPGSEPIDHPDWPW